MPLIKLEAFFYLHFGLLKMLISISVCEKILTGKIKLIKQINLHKKSRSKRTGLILNLLSNIFS